jgi:hypothetical protein
MRHENKRQGNRRRYRERVPAVTSKSAPPASGTIPAATAPNDAASALPPSPSINHCHLRPHSRDLRVTVVPFGSCLRTVTSLQRRSGPGPTRNPGPPGPVSILTWADTGLASTRVAEAAMANVSLCIEHLVVDIVPYQCTRTQKVRVIPQTSPRFVPFARATRAFGKSSLVRKKSVTQTGPATVGRRSVNRLSKPGG